MKMFDDTDTLYEHENDSETRDFDEADDAETSKETRIKALREQLLRAQKERKEYLDGWQRMKADYLNAKKRFDEESVEVTRRAEMRFAEKLLPLVDSFSMALEGLEQQTGTADNPWKTGLLQIHTQLASLLKDVGVTEVEALGHPFDPHMHEALQNQKVDDASQHDQVIAVLQKGYRYRDTLLRPTKVIIGTT